MIIYFIIGFIIGAILSMFATAKILSISFKELVKENNWKLKG